MHTYWVGDSVSFGSEKHKIKNMKDFIVKTNFGVAYQWTKEQIAEDYSSTAIQWQDEDDICEPQTKEQLYDKILEDEDFLFQWFYDYIHGDILYSMDCAEVVSTDQECYDNFIRSCLRTHGSVTIN
jgi:hypothetical protein